MRIRSISAALSLVLFVLSSLILIGYLFRAPPFYGGKQSPRWQSQARDFLVPQPSSLSDN